MTRFAERRQARQENRQDRRNKRRGGASVSSSTCSSKGSKGSCKSHSSHKSSCNSSYSSSCSSKGSHTSNGSDGGNGNTYVMREKLLTIGKDFEIKEASHSRSRGGRTGETKFYVDNKVLRLRETFYIRRSKHGEVLYQVQERKMRVRDTMKIEDRSGKEIAKIKKRMVGVVRDNYVIKVRGDRDWQVYGSILDHNYTVKEGAKTIVKVHKNRLTIKDAYFIDIDEDCDDKALAMMIVIGLDDMADE